MLGRLYVVNIWVVTLYGPVMRMFGASWKNRNGVYLVISVAGIYGSLLQSSAILVTQLLWLLSSCSYLLISFYSSLSSLHLSDSAASQFWPPLYFYLVIYSRHFFCFLPNHLICDSLCVSHIQNPKKRASSQYSQSLALCWVEFLH